MSYKDLCSALPNFVHKDVLAPEILDKKPEVAAAESEGPDDDGEPEDEAPDEACQMGEAFLDAFGSDDDDDDSPPAKKEEPNGVVESKHEEEKQADEESS